MTPSSSDAFLVQEWTLHLRPIPNLDGSFFSFELPTLRWTGHFEGALSGSDLPDAFVTVYDLLPTVLFPFSFFFVARGMKEVTVSTRTAPSSVVPHSEPNQQTGTPRLPLMGSALCAPGNLEQRRGHCPGRSTRQHGPPHVNLQACSWVSSRAFALAICDRKLRVSSDHRPPTSVAITTRRARR